MTRVAAFDCGTNSLRLLVADLDVEKGTSRDVVREMRIVRLGQGVDRTGRIAEASLQRVFAAVEEYMETVRGLDVAKIRFCATSAARDAENAEQFLAGIRERVGVDAEVLVGDDEARTSFAGAVRDLPPLPEPLLVVDIGGGSTELILGACDGSVEAAHSLDIGSVRLNERHLHSDPPAKDEIAAAIEDIERTLDASEVDPTRAAAVIGVAGTVTTIAAGVLGLDSYEPELIHRSVLRPDAVQGAVTQLLAMMVERRKALGYMHPGRADVIGAGGLILDRLLRRTPVNSILVSERDILDGIAWSLVSDLEGGRLMVRESSGLESQQPPGHPLGSAGRVPKRSFVYVFKRTVREFNDDGGTDLAAALTYYSVLAIFPALIAVMSLVGLFGQAQESADKIYNVISPFINDYGTGQRLQEIINGLAQTSAPGTGLLLGVLGALWSASGYVGAFSRAMNKVYEVEEGRPFWRLRPMQILVTIVTVVLCAVALVILVVSGPVTESIGAVLGVGDDVKTLWNIAKWPVLALVVMMIVAILYWVTPNVKFPSFRLISVGAFVAILVWIVASVGFAYYVSRFGSYNKTYGSIAGGVVALLWIWITNNALVFGAELDAELERGRQLQRGMAAEKVLQLPVRDKHGIEKAHKRRAEDVDERREIRLAAAGGGDPADRPFGT